ncbi:hypothetical protein CFOL_v3_22067 [Cephalotus follicularis]|uniref:Exo_endo_phos domain-containing protein n=1 Tax=Cephalotus follicularis TaxID=3775 RepID=A0A1Q3CEN4_CEPFO|nr:hypothetical protein CFOL_v3_22067 [Cephalotus follicularis]
MNLLSWNCRGLGSLRSDRPQIKKSPNCVFLSETRLFAQEIEFIRIKSGYKNCFTVNVEVRSGGLALLWDEDLDLSIYKPSLFLILTPKSKYKEGLNVGGLQAFMGNQRLTFVRISPCGLVFGLTNVWPKNQT